MDWLFRFLLLTRVGSDRHGHRVFRPLGILGPAYLLDLESERRIVRRLGGTQTGFLIVIVVSLAFGLPSTAHDAKFNILGAAAALVAGAAYYWWSYTLTRGLTRA